MSRHTAKKPSGHTIVTDLETGQLHERDTLQCKHCGFHWEVQPGSGKRRGYCMNCAGPTCGKPGCHECVNESQRLDNLAAGKPELHKPVNVYFPTGLWTP